MLKEKNPLSLQLGSQQWQVQGAVHMVVGVGIAPLNCNELEVQSPNNVPRGTIVKVVESIVEVGSSITIH